MRYISLLLAILPLNLLGQGHIPVFPGLNGDSLIIAIRSNYSPDAVLDYDMARDTLFKNIDAVNDTLYCVYTTHAVYLPPGVDPTIAAFKNGNADGINTEHSWPRSKGAGSGNAESDMHHLFPTRTPVNADRASLPFGEVNDNSTLKWYYKNMTSNQIPGDNVDSYSELGSDKFEPRENFKGDIARAMFYFYTIYKEQADDEDPEFFNIQREDLCAWHLQDEIDLVEWERTQKIAAYQDGKANPFILDCSLAFRSYCPEYSPCQTSSSKNSLSENKWKVYPNPVKDILKIEINGANEGRVIIRDLFGRPMLERVIRNTSMSVDVRHWPGGVYFISYQFTSAAGPVLSTKKVSISRD